jgi:hypothetical protein
MMREMAMSSAVLLGLGAFHGINPAMGWLFAVSLGMQERSRSAVLRALLPLALGHALAVALAIAIALAIGVIIPIQYVRRAVAVFLIALAISRLFRHKHPRWASMRVGMCGLTLWSFLMAGAHGAGLMVVPFFVRMTMAGGGHGCHTIIAANSGAGAALTATSLHAAGYLAVTAVTAVLVFEKFGVGLLRKAWFNLDLVWAGTLLATGGLTLLF